MRESVLLFPGHGEMPVKMAALSYWLRWAGYITEIIDYPSTRETAEELVANHFAPAMKARENLPVVHCVTNSLGGILLRGYLATHRQPNLGRVVMICPGHHGSEVLEVIRHHPLASAVMGPVIQQSGTGREAYPKQLPPRVDFELGIIAGGISIDPLAYCVAPEMQDGRVTVASSRIAGMKDHIILPLPHEMLAYHPLTAAQAIAFLKNGQFDRALPFALDTMQQAA